MPHILMIATGGTIACCETERGLSPALDGTALLGALPELSALCTVETLDLMQLDSTDVTAAAHTATTLANSFRPDGSTYHTFFMNPDGTPKGGRTCQGYKDDSFWARGQAWGVYGSAIGYTYTHDEKFLDVFRKALAFYLSRLPEDMIPCWDMLFAPESGEPRDSSSAAIVACGLLEAAKYVDETEAAQWRTLARQMLASLAANYAVKPGTLGSGQLLHGTYSKKSPYNTCTPEGVDECTSWGDYFYMEALTRLTKDWEMYW